MVVYLLEHYPSTYKLIIHLNLYALSLTLILFIKRLIISRGELIILIYLNVVACDGLGFTVKIKSIACSNSKRRRVYIYTYKQCSNNNMYLYI